MRIEVVGHGLIGCWHECCVPISATAAPASTGVGIERIQLDGAQKKRGAILKIASILQYSLVRYGLVIGVAFIIADLLFYGMHLLISTGNQSALGDVEPNRVIEFVRVKPPQETPIEDKTLPPKQLSDVPPPPNFELTTTATGGDGPVLSYRAPEITPPEPKLSMPNLQAVGSKNTGILPLVRVQPMYPRDAANQRIEGWVVIEFTISTNGRVLNPRVIREYPNEMFNTAALKAIKKWRYRPRVENGLKVEVHNVSVRLKFELDEMM